MAFFDVRDLKHQIEEYLTGKKSWDSDPSSRRMLVLAYHQVLACLELSKRVFGRNGKPYQILLKAVIRLEKVLESHVLKRTDLLQEIHLFAETMRTLEEEFADQLYYSLPVGGGEEVEVVSYADNTKMVGFSNQYQNLKTMVGFSMQYEHLKNLLTDDLEEGIHLITRMMHELHNSLYGGEGEEEDEVVSSAENTKMVGFSNQYQHQEDNLTEDEPEVVAALITLAMGLFMGTEIMEHFNRLLTKQSPQLAVYALIGMPGIGKTTLARKFFMDPEIKEHYESRVWVRVGKHCRFNEMLQRILVEMGVEEDGDVVESLNRSLKGKRYLIVLDDVWDIYGAICLREGIYSSRGSESQLRYPFPNDDNGSLLLVISRLEQKHITKMEMKLMNIEDSWRLLREKVFGQERCPPHLEKFGRKIAKKCEGHPLTIVTVANLLSREDKTAEYWNEVATRKRHQLFKDAYDEMYKVLLPSFNHLPPCLQKCFMYIGMFPPDYEIPKSKLINLWITDGFLELIIDQQRDVAVECLEELVSNSTVMIKLTLNFGLHIGEKRIKTCKLHSSLRYLSNREGSSNKFCHVLDSIHDGVGEDIKAQPRLSFHNNVLFAIKVVNKSVEDNCASTAHSLFCYGPYLQYQVPICFGLRLLKKLDALGIRFYEFPEEVLQLVELRYLALTLNGNLPPSVSQLSKLRFLIVHPHQRIKSCKGSCYLPMEIWNMQELEHLEVAGKDLPNPCGASMKNLSTLATVSPNRCTIDVLEALPNLKRLGIEVEVRHDNDGEPINCLAHVGRLELLDRLKCVVVNPTLSYSFSSPSSFPRSLKKLTLDGLGYAWKEMDNIGSLENLCMLKLRNYAFRGPEWEVREKKFPNLISLIIEDTDLERWKIGYKNIGMQHLVMKGLYKLKEIYGEFGYLAQVEIGHCNPIGTNQLKEVTPSDVKLIESSWYDEKPEP